MKVTAFFIALTGAYLYLSSHTPVKEVAQVVTGQEVPTLRADEKAPAPATTNALKRPIDRTREVLGKVAAGNAGNQF
jgi:hypothetical protein